MSDVAKKKPLWVCPECGGQFVAKNMWHSCGKWTAEMFLQNKGERAKLFFDSFVKLVQNCGPVRIAAAKTEIAFMTRVRFAQVKRVSEKGMTCAFWLKQRIQSQRLTRVDRVSSKNWIYTFRVADPKQLDAEVQSWICLAYKTGEQEG